MSLTMDRLDGKILNFFNGQGTKPQKDQAIKGFSVLAVLAAVGGAFLGIRHASHLKKASGARTLAVTVATSLLAGVAYDCGKIVQNLMSKALFNKPSAFKGTNVAYPVIRCIEKKGADKSDTSLALAAGRALSAISGLVFAAEFVRSAVQSKNPASLGNVVAMAALGAGAVLARDVYSICDRYFQNSLTHQMTNLLSSELTLKQAVDKTWILQHAVNALNSQRSRR